MKKPENFDVIIIGGSYSGLAAAMALGRALRKALVIDNGVPCNRQTPYSHNFITHDGMQPAQISAIAKQQVAAYETVSFFNGIAAKGVKTINGFEIQTGTGETFSAQKLIFATGIKDLLPDIDGFAECWGISVIHCPYCHGYEVRHEKTGIFGNGEFGFELAKLISNWTKDLTLFTNGASTLTADQMAKLDQHNIKVVEKVSEKLIHVKGQLQYILFKDNSKAAVKALYAPSPFQQHCPIPEALGCALNAEGYLQTDSFQKTTVDGIYACGDNTNRMRTLANAVATGTTAGMVLNKEIITENF
ncbi:NAD(P)/FAD-dependent oxidoreductase [Mucilaginibacter sp.]|uniref:NAD(P)/FAD-dependent oxidoreductase n=1 Tax=Mucilaginibacter sp. TaxID=1882438 RepID=UPI0032669628